MKVTRLKLLLFLFIISITAATQNMQQNVKDLIDMSYNYQYYKNDSAKHFARKAISLAEKLNYSEGIVLAYIELAWSFKANGEPDSAIVFFNHALEKAEKNLSFRSTILSGMAGAYKDKGDFDLAIRNYEKCIEIDTKLSDSSGLAKCYGNIAIAYNLKGNTEKAIDFCNKQAAIYKKAGSYELHYSYNNMGTYYFALGDYENAVDFFLKALKLQEEKNDSLLMGSTYGNISNVFRVSGNFEKAVSYANKCMQIFSNMQDYGSICKAKVTLGSIYLDKQMPDSARTYYLEALQIAEKINDLNQKSIVLSDLGHIALQDKNYKLALEYLLDAKEIKEKIGNKLRIAITYNNIGRCYIELGDFTKALSFLTSAYTYSLNGEAKTEQRDIALSISTVNEKLGNYKDAFKYLKIFYNLNDSILGLEKNLRIEELEKVYQTEKKDRELATKNLEIFENELKLSNRNKLIYGLIGGIISLLFIALFILQRNKRKAEKEKNRAIITEQEKGLEGIINAQEEERKRVAKDLHDGVGQQISALNLNFQSLASNVKNNSPELAELTEKIGKMIKETGNDIRIISHQMMPRTLTELGLIEAVEDIIDKSFSYSGIKCDFEHINLQNRLPQNIEIGLYRIIQELINNIIKHSQATSVSIQLMKNETNCILVVHDNGKGLKFDKTSGIGIQNMNTRINALKGEFNLESDEGKGTTAFIKIKI